MQEDNVTTTPPQAIEIPPGLIAALAAGIDEPSEVAARFGIEGDVWDKLQRWKPFLEAVEAQKVEFRETGYTFRVESALKADILSDQLFVLAMSNEATLPQKNDILKTFAKLGDLEPKTAAQQPASTGPRFSITINTSNSPAPTTIDITPEPVAIPADE
jgi:hypothetical protein